MLIICEAHFFGDDLNSVVDNRGFLRVGHANAFVPVRPVFCQAGEKVFTRDDEDASPFQSLIKLITGNG